VIEIAPDEQQIIILRLSSDAPEGGLWITDETDVPDSIMMSEIYVEEGARTVSVRLQGLAEGTGSLFFDAPGFEELQLPVIVEAEADMYVEEEVIEEPIDEAILMDDEPVLVDDVVEDMELEAAAQEPEWTEQELELLDADLDAPLAETTTEVDEVSENVDPSVEVNPYL
jgi:hypothetical protein